MRETIWRISRRRKLLAAAVVTVLLPVGVQSAELDMLSALAKGGWTMRVRDNGGGEQRICVRSGREFIQLRHAQSGCSQFVVEDKSDLVVVQYTCRGNGYGRTSLRREAPGLLQIDSQGVVDGAPFAFTAEARHGGAC